MNLKNLDYKKDSPSPCGREAGGVVLESTFVDSMPEILRYCLVSKNSLFLESRFFDFVSE